MSPDLPPRNLVDTPYRDAHHLLDTHVRLMKEDVVRPLRQGVAAFLANDYHAASEQVSVYHEVAFTSVACDHNLGLIYRITFRTPRNGMDWSRSSKLMYGSLVLLTQDRLETEPIWAEVHNRDEEFMNGFTRPSIDIRILQGEHPVADVGSPPQFIMIEASQSYFQPHGHVISAMQRLGQPPHEAAATVAAPRDVNQPPPTQLPFVENLAKIMRDVQAPAYLDGLFASSEYDMSCVYPGLKNLIGSRTFDILEPWPAGLDNDIAASMDPPQTEALKHILTNRVAVVQGPPGTGKTYVALKALRVLLHPINRERRENGPILVVALTNHALDQILENVLTFEKSVVRVGGRSESCILQEKLLWAAREKSRRDGTNYRVTGLGNLMGERTDLQRIIGQGIQQMARGITLRALEENQLATSEQLEELHVRDISSKDLESDSEHEDSEARHHESQAHSSNERNWRPPIDKYKPQSSSQANVSASAPSDVKADDGWQKVRTRRVVRRYEVVDYWLREHQIRAARAQKKIRKDEEKARRAAQQMANIATMKSQNPFAALTDDARPPTPSSASSSSAPASSSAASSQGRLPLPPRPSLEMLPAILRQTIESDSDDEDAEEIAQVKRERQMDWSEARPKSQMAAMPEAMCPRGYREPSQAVITSPLFALSPHDRACLHWYWLQKLREKILARLQPAIRDFEQVNREIQELYRQGDHHLLSSARVVGMTTSGAAQLQELVQQLKPAIVIMEEAAEVLEAHVLACLSSTLQHLILIGDHKPLQPTTSHFDLTRIFKLNISLFERLVNAGVESRRLQTQRRMRPEIRELSSFHYDDSIADGANVLLYPPVTGISSSLFFLSHHAREGGGGDQQEPGRFNVFEADMAVRLALYMCKSGYNPKDIKLLTTYKEQLRLIKRTIARFVPDTSDPMHQMLIRVVDKYQGEENRIIILSLVQQY